MVLYYTSNTIKPAGFIYVGKDKFENEDLIKHGWEEDVWVCTNLQFHVDKLSSAHIYFRMSEGQTWDNLPEPLIIDLAQLTKANSIEGNKKDNITIIYTPWFNLHKDGSMATGQVSFKNPHLVKRVLVAARENAVVNRLNKTKVERYPDLAAEKEGHLKEVRKREQVDRLVRRKEELDREREFKEKKWKKEHAYDEMFSEEAMMGSSNQDRDENWEDDFM